MKKLTEDEKWMKTAIREAKKAKALEETPIGCVLIQTKTYDGEILEKPRVLAKAYNRRNTDKSTLAHAEILAIQKAAKKTGDWRLEGCTMYVTLEPCPMCAGALLQSRIDRVVFGAENKKAGAVGSTVNLLENDLFNHKAEIVRHVLEEECSAMMSEFFRELREKKK